LKQNARAFNPKSAGETVDCLFYIEAAFTCPRAV
jgi:hypothetical protein